MIKHVSDTHNEVTRLESLVTDVTEFVNTITFSLQATCTLANRSIHSDELPKVVVDHNHNHHHHHHHGIYSAPITNRT